MIRHISALAAWMALAAANVDTADTVIVGVLEDLPSGPKEEPAPRTHVRVAFRKAGDRWEAFPDGFVRNHPLVFEKDRYERELEALRKQLPTALGWAVCFDGRDLGSLRSTLPPAWSSMALRGTHVVAAGQDAPHVGKKTTEFSGWPDEPVYRPLVLASSRRCSDPDAWKPRPLPRPLAVALPARLREASNTVRTCEDESGAIPCDLGRRTWKLTKSYGSSRNEWLILAIAEERTQAPLPVLFHVSASGQARVLGLDMNVVDTGDWDGDGRSELLVMFQRYDHDGYTLFYGREFEESVTFGWMYH